MSCSEKFLVLRGGIIICLLLVPLCLGQDEPPKIQSFSFQNLVKFGDKASVTCIVSSGKGPWTFKWLKNGVEVKNKDAIRIRGAEDFSVIVIEPIDSQSGGNYTCTVSGPSGKDSHSASLTVKAPPQWLVKPETTITTLGAPVNLDCQVIGSPKPRLAWKRLEANGTPESELFLNSLRGIVQPNGTLHFGQTTADVAGSYVCEVSNELNEKISARADIVIRVPARFEEKFLVMNTRRGESAKLECNALGDQPLTVTWRKEKKQLSKLDSNRYEIFETLTKEGVSSELVIRSAERDDGAMYTCTAENEFGKDERKIRVLVLEVPAPPLDVKVREVWTRSASVSWSAPYSGNSPITKYVVQYWRDQGAPHRLHEITVTSSQLSAMMKDLHPGTSYVVKIVAENEVGRGVPSDAVSLQTGEEEPTAPPVDITVEPKGPSTIRVTWKPPPKDHWNGQLKGYYVGYKARDSSQPYSYKSVEFLVDSTQEYFLSNLARGTEYNVVVKAFNLAGSGPASHEAVARTSDGDLPPPPTVFVTSTTTNSITLRWNSKHDSPTASGYTVHFREEGGPWQELTILKPEDSSYTLNGLISGTLYQIYLTGTTTMGRGDPSDLIAVKTEGGTEQSVSAGSPTPALMLDLSILIPVAASLVATIVVFIVACLCVHKIRQRQHLERAIAEQQIAYKGTIQRYVDIEKARLSGACMQGTLTNQGQIQMRDMLDDTSSKEEDNPEMKSFLPAQNQHLYQRPYQHAPASNYYSQRV